MRFCNLVAKIPLTKAFLQRLSHPKPRKEYNELANEVLDKRAAEPKTDDVLQYLVRLRSGFIAGESQNIFQLGGDSEKSLMRDRAQLLTHMCIGLLGQPNLTLRFPNQS